MSDNEKNVVKLFEFFYNKLYKTNFKLDLSLNNQAKIVRNFIDLLAKQYTYDTVGINFLIDYFSFGFHYFYTKKLKRNISLNWIVGKKLFTKYIERKEGTDYYTSEFLREYQINIDDLRSALIEVPPNVGYDKVDDSEEMIKSSIADGAARLYSCMIGTTMFHHRSITCVMCKQKTTCKDLLQKINPSLYRNRGYGQK